MKSANVHARVSPELKQEVEVVLNELGLSFSQAIEMYLRQIKLNHGIPFPVKIPNELTIQTFEKTDRGEDLNHYKNAKDMFDRLNDNT